MTSEAATRAGRTGPAGGRRGLRRRSMLLGPAFVAAVAYVDPGNVGTNTAAGARYGYMLVWVVVAANLLAVLVQYLSAKVTIASGRTLPELCHDRYGPWTRRGLLVQGEAVAIATDVAEVLGGALALNLLFGVPLVTGGVITGVVSMLLLGTQRWRGQRSFERVIVGLLAVVLVGFLWAAFAGESEPGDLVGGLVPRLAGLDSLVLATGMLGATVMPHAIWLHGALVRDRHGDVSTDVRRRSEVLAATRLDIVTAMGLAGLVNLGLLVAAAASLRGTGVETIEGAYEGYAEVLGPAVAVLFALGLLASGLASSSVGTYAGSVILEGFGGQGIPLLARRLLTLVPALAVLWLGVDPTNALVLSQVVLSFGIPFALWPLVRMTADRRLMGEMTNVRRTTVAAYATAGAITLLNVVLLVLTFAGSV